MQWSVILDGLCTYHLTCCLTGFRNADVDTPDHRPLLGMVCALIAGFAMNFRIVNFVNHSGYDGAFGIYAAIFTAIVLFGFPIFS
jgi:hypothetical protein